MAFHTPDPKQKQDSGGLKTLVQAEKMIQIAILLPAAVFIGYILGYWLDKTLHQSWISIRQGSSWAALRALSASFAW